MLATDTRFCEKCGAQHGLWPLGHLKPSDDCDHNPARQCRLCGNPVGPMSFGGPEICVACDVGCTCSTCPIHGKTKA
jgi:hypothetical protein